VGEGPAQGVEAVRAAQAAAAREAVAMAAVATEAAVTAAAPQVEAAREGAAGEGQGARGPMAVVGVKRRNPSCWIDEARSEGQSVVGGLLGHRWRDFLVDGSTLQGSNSRV